MALLEQGAPTLPRRPAVVLRAFWPGGLGVKLPAGMLLIIVGACFLLPLTPLVPRPVGGSILEANLPLFSPGHVLGTDVNGNDNAARLLHGGRASISIAVAVNILGLLVGGVLGAIAGYVGRALDIVIPRILDAMIAFPSLILVIAVANVLGPSYLNTIWALSFFSIPSFARVARAATLRLRSELFITAAQLSGTRLPRALLRHVAPNILPQLVTFGFLGAGVVMILEGGLGYLGLGVQPPHPSWGNMVSQGQQSMLTNPLLVFLPGGALFVTVLSFNLLGEALRARWGRQ